MASIILDPGEVFEHSHTTDSITHLRRGSIRLNYGADSVRMHRGQRLEIPAGVPHTLENVGTGRAYVSCYHAPNPDDEKDLVPRPPR